MLEDLLANRVIEGRASCLINEAIKASEHKQNDSELNCTLFKTHSQFAQSLSVDLRPPQTYV